MPVITLAHLSDPHLDGSAACRRRLTAAVDLLMSFTAGPDLVLVTGDLTERPDAATDDAAAAAAAAAELQWLQRTLDPIGVPVLLLPGNSDDRDAFRNLVGAAGSGQVNRAIVAAGLRFLLLDSSIPGQFAGRLDPDTLRWLADELDAADATDAAAAPPTVIALHHPPVDLGHPVVDSLRLQNPEPLRDLLSGRDNLIATLVGHTHAATAAEFAGRPLIVAPGIHSIGQLPWHSDGSLAGLIDGNVRPGLAVHRIDLDAAPGEGRLVSYFASV